MNRILKVRKSKLNGTVKISGAKNSALKLLSASILTNKDVVLYNSPNSLIDMKIHIEMLKNLGKECIIEYDRITIKESEQIRNTLRWGGDSIRNTLLIFGALLSRFGHAMVPLPGGCELGCNRKYDLHIDILSKMGANIYEDNGYLIGVAEKGLQGCEIDLLFRSVGATENAIISAVLAKGTTIIKNPHFNPEIEELVFFLEDMGANIKLENMKEIVIKGINKPLESKFAWRVIPDRLEALTYLIASCVTHSNIVIENFPFEYLNIPLSYLYNSNIEIKERDGNNIYKLLNNKIYPFEISCDSYPGITSDMKSLFTVLGLKIKGRSEIIDLRYPKRNKYIDELLKMKAVIGEVLNSNYRLAIYGGNKLIGTEVEATDLRGGVALLLAGLIAEGETIIHNANQIYRGYEHIDKKLKNLGANIELIEE